MKKGEALNWRTWESMQVQLGNGKQSRSLESLSSLPTAASGPHILSHAVCVGSA